jgi:hypothetical protein
LLNSGFVHPAEFIVRNPPYSVECELGTEFGSRAVLDLSTDLDRLKQYSEIDLKVPSRYKLNNFIEAKTLLAYQILSNEELASL